MAGPGRQAQARRRNAAAMLVAAAHLAALWALGWSVDPRLRPPAIATQPSLELALVRLAPPKPAPPRAEAAPAAPRAPPRPAALPPAALPRPLALPSPVPLAVPSLPAASGRPPTPAPPEAGGDLRGLLRATVGCHHEDYMKLSPPERARCDSGYGVAARTGEKLDTIPLEKRAAFSRQALADEAKRARREVALPNSPVVACTGAGSNFGMGCLPPEAIHGFKP